MKELEKALKRAREGTICPRVSTAVRQFRKHKKARKMLKKQMFDMSVLYNEEDIIERALRIVKKFDRTIIANKKICANSIFKYREKTDVYIGMLFLIDGIQHGALTIHTLDVPEEYEVINALIADTCEVIIETHEDEIKKTN